MNSLLNMFRFLTSKPDPAKPLKLWPTFDRVQQVRARPVRPVPSQTRLGGPCTVPVRSPQSYPQNDGATRAACAHRLSGIVWPDVRDRINDQPAGRRAVKRAHK
jgi:hypothetical protein